MEAIRSNKLVSPFSSLHCTHPFWLAIFWYSPPPLAHIYRCIRKKAIGNNSEVNGNNSNNSV